MRVPGPRIAPRQPSKTGKFLLAGCAAGPNPAWRNFLGFGLITPLGHSQRGPWWRGSRRRRTFRLFNAAVDQRNVIVRPHGEGMTFVQLDDLKAVGNWLGTSAISFNPLSSKPRRLILCQPRPLGTSGTDCDPYGFTVNVFLDGDRT
jgi:hypothetical protein